MPLASLGHAVAAAAAAAPEAGATNIQKHINVIHPTKMHLKQSQVAIA